MIALTLAEMAVLTAGEVRDEDQTIVVSAAASIDSRAVETGGLFVAIVGEHVDGHEYAEQAVAQGAAAVLASRPVPAPCVVVADPVIALGQIAAHVRSRLATCIVIALTGSQGKTSTKDILAQILEPAGPTIATRGNLNNELGVPLTILRADESTRYLVVEMGARGIGNIRYLCDIAQPSIGVVLNVGTAHVGEFGSRDNIAIAKGEIVEALPPHGTAVLNFDDGAVLAMRGRTRARVETFGADADADVRIVDLQVGPSGEPRFGLTYRDEATYVDLPLLGSHQAFNAAAAAATALGVGLELEAIAGALSEVESRSAWRMERHRRSDGTLIVNDAYNANPDSMAAALKTLADLGANSRSPTVAVLGEMLELGSTSASEHVAVGRLAADLGITQVVAVGAGALGIAEGAATGGVPVAVVEDHQAASAWLDEHVQAGDVVLIKASRGAGLERVATALLDPARDTATGARPAPDPSHGYERDDAR